MTARHRNWIPGIVALLGAGVAVVAAAFGFWLESVGPGGANPGGWSLNPAIVDTLRKFDPLVRLELITYDWRARRAAGRTRSFSTNLGFVTLDDKTIVELQRGSVLGVRLGPLWPRYVYALALRELQAQGAQGVAMDILLGDERPDHGNVPLDGLTNSTSDGFLAQQLAQFDGAILASVTNLPPAYPFRRAAHQLGGAEQPLDVDGTARRVRAFEDYQLLNPILEARARRQGLVVTEVAPDAVMLEGLDGGSPVRWPINPDGSVRVRLPSGELTVDSVYVSRRIWHMGIVLASKRLGLDLGKAVVEPGSIHFPDTNGVIARLLPVTADNLFPVNWTITSTNQDRIGAHNLMSLIADGIKRERYPDRTPPNFWTNALVVIGSTATGNNLTDRGTTPIAPLDFLASTYLNVADSMLRAQFVHVPPQWVTFVLVLAAALVGSGFTWRLSPGWASLSVISIGCLWLLGADWAFQRDRLWLPIATPLLAGLLLNHAAMLTYRSVFEQGERQRVRRIFSKIVSPNVVQELLKSEQVGLSGSRRQLTVFFSDVRGFTELTDRVQLAAEAHVQAAGLNGAAAEAYFEQQSAEVLATVNLYLATIADVIKRHRGTLDKYIGDCVMAFWGAPTPNPRHAVDAVCAAIEAQQAILRLNSEREAENRRREADNLRRVAQQLPSLPPLAQLALGTGINTGNMTVGLMGSDSHILNYTVFGREVNLASRLEGISGRGRIIIGEATYRELQQHLPHLAAHCVALDPVTVKGFRQTVPVYEVPWRDAETAAVAAAAIAVAVKVLPPESNSQA